MTGTEYAISAGEYDAVIATRGAALRQLQHCGRDLVVSFDAGAPIPDFRGVIAAPWPNRIADGQYTFDGTQYQVEINEPERSTALHELVFDREWELQDHGDSSVTLVCELEPTKGYPFPALTAGRVDPRTSGKHVPGGDRRPAPPAENGASPGP